MKQKLIFSYFPTVSLKKRKENGSVTVTFFPWSLPIFWKKKALQISSVQIN